MAKVNVQVAGGQIQQIEAATVAEVKQKLNASTYTATINGEPAQDSQSLTDYQFVALAAAVKGA